MKLAIIGSGPLAIFCAQYFDQIGAEVTLFQKNALGGNVRFLLDHFPEMEVTYQNQTKTIKSLWDENITPAITDLEERHLTKAGEVLRVHKRFLHPEETITNKSRLHDLFRVIYSVNPKEAILKQLEENPDMFKQLGEQVMNSLHLPVESFEDFDLVIEARGFGRTALGMGPSNAMALNENNIKEVAALYYEKDIFSKLTFAGKKHLILVGHSETAILALLKCKEWIFSNPKHSLSWVTSASVNKKLKNNWLNIELEKLLHFSQALFNKEKSEFEKKMHDWRDLEDYIKVKIPKPIEPEAKLKVFQGYDVTSVDRLLDREGVFTTIETPDFRDYAKTPNDLKTLPAEAILVSCGVDPLDSKALGLQAHEPGFYQLNATDLTEGLAQIKLIEEKILAFFSRAQ
ncbi:MAG: hypothetical protein PHY93_00965 [Bacteriovorax sp.]|nr:hypothetical protein [Bacteriovorax sp.]